MSINRSQELQSGDSSVFNDYRVSEGSSNSTSQDAYARRQEEGFNDLDNYNTYSWNKPYTIPLKSVKNRMSTVVQDITELLSTYEQNLKNVYLNPYLDPGLEDSHFHIWDELSSNNKSLVEEYFPASTQSTQGEMTTAVEEVDETDAGDDTVIDVSFGLYTPPTDPDNNTTSLVYPQYVSFSQYLYAEKHGCRGCRKFVKDYDRLISHSVFVHLFDFRYFLKLLLHEANNIKNSLTYDFGDTYEDESQQQAASFYFSWAEMAAHYTKVIAEQLSQGQDYLSSSEVDYISKKQAAQFQAFFAIRLNAVDAEINDQIASLKRDLVDNCEIFYNRFISPSLRISKDISNPLEFDFLTTRFSKDNPMLSGELVVATNLIKGNFASIHADCMQRFEMMSARVDSMMSLIHEKRKYANYISQLGNKSVQKRQVLKTVENDIYSALFRNIYTNTNRNNTFLSSHSRLDGLLDNDHPQYLLKDKGNITGDIFVEEGITIDGVDLSEHAHTGSDGSHRIKSTDIDYDNIRIQNTTDAIYAIKPLSVTVDGFVSDIIPGGIPVFDTIISIEVDDITLNTHEYEILYTEVI
jgi:hypothetical protein